MTDTCILKEKERWLSITTEQANLKKFREPNWPKLEQALSLWVDNALYSQQDITGKRKSKPICNQVFNQQFSFIRWMVDRGYGLRQFRKQSEAASARLLNC